MILDDIVEKKQIRLKEHKSRIHPAEMIRLADKAQASGGNFYQALKKPGISIIGEFKKASPSLGKIRQTMELTDRIDEYNRAVDCISCLTEEDYFLGSTEYLRQIRGISPLPILRKDFMIDPYQFYEAKAIGADAILLAKNVDGVYDSDPRVNPEAKLLRDITYQEVQERDLKVMDASAITICRENKVPCIRVFGLDDPQNILRVIEGDMMGTVVHP